MISAGFVAASMVALPVCGADLFLHVDLQEFDDGAHVRVNLPMAVVEKGITLMPRPFHVDGHITIGDLRLSRFDLEHLYEAVRDLAPDAAAELRIDRRRVEVSKTDGQVMVVAGKAWRWWQEDVRFSLPVLVLAAFLDGESRDLDLVAGLRVLADREGSIVMEVDNGRSEARVWVDDKPDSGR